MAPISINGTTGISGVDGSAGTPALQGSDTNTGIAFGSDVIIGSTGGTERFRCDSGGRMLVGTSTSGTALLQVNAQTSASGNAFRSSHRIADSGTGVTQSVNAAPYISYCAGLNAAASVPAIVINGEDFAGGNFGLQLELNCLKSSGAVASEDRLGRITFGGDDATNIISAASIAAFVDGTPGTNDMPGRLVFSTTADGASSPTERMRITSDGQLRTLAAQTAFLLSAASSAGTSEALIEGKYSASSTGGGTTSFIVYTNGNVRNTNNSYGAISDVKLKENIVDAGSQWDDLKALQVRKYNFKEGQTHTQIGLVAQEVELISPGLVTESPDRDEDGNDLGTVTKSVNYSVLYMKAVKALQEAMERIESLETRLAALEVTP